MEIERKFLIDVLPDHLESYPHHRIEQAYLNTDPVIRIRRQDNDYIFTYKGRGMLSREEVNLPMCQADYDHLLTLATGTVITKCRYVIPLENGLSVELDLFEGTWSGLILAEVEFPTEEMAHSFMPPSWFAREVTYDEHYHNSWLSQHCPE